MVRANYSAGLADLIIAAREEDSKQTKQPALT
jgi:hypothetical protein